MSASDITRRAVILAGFGSAGALVWNVNSLTASPGFARVFGAAEDWTSREPTRAAAAGSTRQGIQHGGHIADIQTERHL